MSLIEKIGIGTVQFGLNYGISNKFGKTNFDEVKKILKFGYDYGIRVIDTARAYGDAELILGQTKKMKEFQIVSKFMPSESDGNVLTQFEKSSSDLKVESLYAYIAHRPIELLSSQNDWENILQLKIEKKVKKIGFSLNSTEELSRLLDLGFIPDLIQVPYNYFDKRFEKQMIELKLNGCEIHTRSSFLQGLFFMKSEDLGSFFHEIKPTIEELQTKYLDTLPEILLRHVIEKEFIDRVMIGVENLSQLKQLLSLKNQNSGLKNLPFTISENILNPSKWQLN